MIMVAWVRVRVLGPFMSITRETKSYEIRVCPSKCILLNELYIVLLKYGTVDRFF